MTGPNQLPPCPLAHEGLCKLERTSLCHDDWEKAFKMIELENSLADKRFAALLTLQGFLFTGFAFGINHLQPAGAPAPATNQYLASVLVVICLMGIVSPIFTFRGMKAAYRQIIASALWLHCVRECSEHKKLHPYPPIVGRPDNENYDNEDLDGDKINVRLLAVGVLNVPPLLICLWLLLLVGLIWANFGVWPALGLLLLLFLVAFLFRHFIKGFIERFSHFISGLLR